MKLKHEFGHLRQNYSYRDKDISQTRRFMVSDIDEDIFEYPTYGIKLECLNEIKQIMYAFSPAEMQQRQNEMYDIISRMDNDELYDSIPKYIRSRGQCISVIIGRYEYVHGIGNLKKMLKHCEDAIKADQFVIVLLIAYYFKEANLYKPKNKLQRGFIQSFLDGEPLSREDRIYANEFFNWLQDHLSKYIRNIYTIVHYIIYTRLWHYTDASSRSNDINEMKQFMQKNLERL